MSAPAASPQTRRPARLAAFVAFASVAAATCAFAVWAWRQNTGAAPDEATLVRKPTEELVRGLSEHGGDAAYLVHTGKRLNAAGRYAEAGPLFLRALQLEPDSTPAREGLVHAYAGAGRPSDAYRLARSYSDAHPDSAEAHRVLGGFYVLVRSEEEALSALERAVALAPDSGPAWRDLAAARERFRNAARLDKALEASEKAVALLPGDADALLVHARLLERQARPEARGFFERSVAADPSRADARRQFARWLLERGASREDVSRAADEARRSLEAEPKSPLALQSLGIALVRLGKDADAVEPLREAARLAPNAPRAALELARVFGRIGPADEAARWRGEAVKRQNYQNDVQQAFAELTTRPNDKTLLARLGRLTGTHGEIGDATRYRAKAMDLPPDDPRVVGVVAGDLRAGGYNKAADALLARAGQSLRGDTPK